MTEHELWAEELVEQAKEQAKQDISKWRRMLFLSLAVNVILAAVVFFK